MLRLLATFGLAACLTGCTKPASTTHPTVVVTAAWASSSHPAELYMHAAELFEAGHSHEAAFWFYAGQLRYRVHLLARPDLPLGEDPALFASLNHVLGSEVNGYLGGDPAEWRSVVERVLQWDADTPNAFTPKQQFPSAHQQARAGLQQRLTHVDENTTRFELSDLQTDSRTADDRRTTCVV